MLTNVMMAPKFSRLFRMLAITRPMHTRPMVIRTIRGRISRNMAARDRDADQEAEDEYDDALDHCAGPHAEHLSYVNGKPRYGRDEDLLHEPELPVPDHGNAHEHRGK